MEGGPPLRGGFDLNLRGAAGYFSRVGDDDIAEAREVLKEAEAVVIAAGAGMGVDSGLPDFRGDEGFWNAYPPYRKLGVSFVEMANPDHFSRDPAFGWGFYGHRLHLYRETEPHAGFARLREFAQGAPRGYFIFTSNVDGHFEQAGFAADRIVECHGSIHHLQCARDCGCGIWDGGATELQVDEETMRAREPLPRCPECGALARPNILMFGDWGWDGSRTRAQEERLLAWLGALGKNTRLVVIECGAGSAVPTVRLQSERLASGFTQGGLIRINPREAEVPAGVRRVSLEMGAKEAVEALLGF